MTFKKRILSGILALTMVFSLATTGLAAAGTKSASASAISEQQAVTITTQPENIQTPAGTTATFAVVASGSDLTYQWQFKTSTGVKWYNCTNGAESTLAIAATNARDGYSYRCKITDADGNSVLSDVAVLTIGEAPTDLLIVTQPEGITALVGSTATFSVAATGSGITYQWQFMTSTGVKWYNCTNGAESTLDISATYARDGYSYRCKITDSVGNVFYTDVAVLTVVDELPTEPSEALPDLVVAAGETYVFTQNESYASVEITGTVSSDTPVVCFYQTSSTVSNGEIINNVQFVCDYDEVIAIVHTNDVHGHLDIEPYVKGLADQLEASGDYSLVVTVSAGDVYGGGLAVAGSYDGELIPSIVDMVYDVLVPGNNDYGSSNCVYQNLLLTSLYEHTVTLCANLYELSDMDMGAYASSYTTAICGNELFASLYSSVSLNADGTLNLSALNLGVISANSNPYESTLTLTTSNGTVVGLYGLTTDGGAMEVSLGTSGSIASARSCISSLESEGATVIIGVGHTGWMGEGSTENSVNDTNSWQLANTLQNQDVFIDGHTHSIINDGEGILVGDSGVFVNQAMSVGSCIGVCYLYVKDGQVIAKDGEVLTDMTSITPDADVQALVDQFTAKVSEDFGAALATTAYFLNGERLSAANEGGSVRGNETNLGDLMTDIIRGAASEADEVEYDFVAYPGYWLRASIEEGEITVEDIQSVFANPTVLNRVEYTVSEMISMVQSGLKSVYPQTEGQTFMQYSGLEITYTNNGSGTGTLVTLKVGDLLIYDANNGGTQNVGNVTFKGIYALTGGDIDSWTDSTDTWLCNDKTEVQELVINYLQTHVQGVDYVIYENTVAPNGRIVEVDG